MISTSGTSVTAGQFISQHERGPLDGPVVADLAEASTTQVAQMDVAWAARVVAGYAYDAADLLSLLRVLGIVDAPPRWRSQ